MKDNFENYPIAKFKSILRLKSIFAPSKQTGEFDNNQLHNKTLILTGGKVTIPNNTMGIPQVIYRSFSASSKLRLPTIKFRYGLRKPEETRGPGVSATSSTGGQQVESVDDFQLPLRFRRAAISSEEMDYINRGGPA